jgi:hypothetical protein
VLYKHPTNKERPGGGYMVYPLSYCRAGVVYWTCPLLPRRGQEEVMSTSITTKIDPWPGRQDNTTFMTFDITTVHIYALNVGFDQ